MKKKESKEEMNIKIQNSGTGGASDCKGSCSDLAHYINHEDQERIDEGLDPLPYLTPNGDEVSTEEVIAAIDANTKGLASNTDKFYHLVVSPSEEEIKAMGSTDKEVYQNAIKLMKAISDAYAKNFHRNGLEDSSDLELYWKCHFTRGEKGELQFHIHGIVGRKTKPLAGLDGKQLKVSPLTNHKDTVDGAVKGGFDRKTFFRKCEKLFDKLFHYDRKVAETFDFNNAMKHGTLEEKSEQTKLLAEENAKDLKTSISAGINRRRKNLSNKHDIDEIAAMLEGKVDLPEQTSTKETLDDAVKVADMRNTLLFAFANANDKKRLALKLVAEGFTFYFIKAKDVPGIEDIRFVKRGKTYLAHEIMTSNELHTLLSHWHRIGGTKPAFKIREELAQKPSQKKHGGPKLGR